jgi:hypothetical protein
MISGPLIVKQKAPVSAATALLMMQYSMSIYKYMQSAICRHTLHTLKSMQGTYVHTRAVCCEILQEKAYSTSVVQSAKATPQEKKFPALKHKCVHSLYTKQCMN